VNSLSQTTGTSSAARSGQSGQFAQVGNLGTPRTLDAVEPRLPAWSEDWENQVRPRLLTLPAKLGYKRLPGLLWNLYIERFFADLRDYGRLCAEQGRLEEFQEDLIRFQTDLVNTLSDNGCPTPDVRQMDGLSFERSIRHYAGRMRDHWVGRRAFGAGEKAAKFFTAGFLAFPLFAVAYQSMNIGWSPVVVGATILLSLAVCVTYLLGLRSLYTTWAVAGQKAIDLSRHEPGIQFSRGKSWVQLCLLSVLLGLITLGWITVDSKYLVWATANDAWGDLNPNRLSFHEALAIAAVFNGLLLFSSWGYLHLTDAVKWARQKGDELISDLRTRMKDPLSSVKGGIAEIDLLQSRLPEEKEAKLHSARVAAWVDMFVVLTAMTKHPGLTDVEDRLIDHIGILGCGGGNTPNGTPAQSAAGTPAIS
jgi:hypothetical protein